MSWLDSELWSHGLEVVGRVSLVLVSCLVGELVSGLVGELVG